MNLITFFFAPIIAYNHYYQHMVYCCYMINQLRIPHMPVKKIGRDFEVKISAVQSLMIKIDTSLFIFIDRKSIPYFLLSTPRLVEFPVFLLQSVWCVNFDSVHAYFMGLQYIISIKKASE